MSRRRTAAMSGPVPDDVPGPPAGADPEAPPAGALPASTCPASALGEGEVPPSRASSPSVSRSRGLICAMDLFHSPRVRSDLHETTPATVKSTYLIGNI